MQKTWIKLQHVNETTGITDNFEIKVTGQGFMIVSISASLISDWFQCYCEISIV
jgi:hypothetical protein